MLAVAYFLILPTFWPKPKITLSILSTYQNRKIDEATVSIHSWHSNFSLFVVNGTFNVDKTKNNGNAVISKNLLPEMDTKKWDALHTFGINRWTWPRVYNFRIELPIEELREKTVSDQITGRIYVKVRYADVWKRFTLTSDTTLVERVKIVLPE